MKRTRNAVRNVIFGGLLKGYQILVPFIMRTLLIRYLGMEYLLISQKCMNIKMNMKVPTCIVVLIFTLSTVNVFAQNDYKWGEWTTWGDQGDGTYCNPVLPSDYSDIDCIRVGDDYYAISSTFQYSPGMVIIHSKDLVNWTKHSSVLDTSAVKWRRKPCGAVYHP